MRAMGKNWLLIATLLLVRLQRIQRADDLAERLPANVCIYFRRLGTAMSQQFLYIS